MWSIIGYILNKFLSIFLLLKFFSLKIKNKKILFFKQFFSKIFLFLIKFYKYVKHSNLYMMQFLFYQIFIFKR